MIYAHENQLWEEHYYSYTKKSDRLISSSTDRLWTAYTRHFLGLKLSPKHRRSNGTHRSNGSVCRAKNRPTGDTSLKPMFDQQHDEKNSKSDKTVEKMNGIFLTSHFNHLPNESSNVCLANLKLKLNSCRTQDQQSGCDNHMSAGNRRQMLICQLTSVNTSSLRLHIHHANVCSGRLLLL